MTFVQPDKVDEEVTGTGEQERYEMQQNFLTPMCFLKFNCRGRSDESGQFPRSSIQLDKAYGEVTGTGKLEQ